jgi:hypothetical protein
LASAHFLPEQALTVSHFRIPILKRVAPTSVLVAADSLVQHSGKWWQLSPSVFVASRAEAKGEPAAPDAFFACPACQTPLGEAIQERLHCTNRSCGRTWQLVDGLYDFKEPRATND